MAGNAKLLATAISQSPSLSFLRAFPTIDVRTLEPGRIVDALLMDWRPDQEAVVLSAENFRPGHAAKLKLLLPRFDTTVVLFVRAQDQWMESYYNQLMKTGDIHQPVRSFIESTFDQRSDRLCCPDWWVHYTVWRETFDDCRVLFYDEARSDLFGSFFDGAELPRHADIAEIPRQQESMSLYQLTYLGLLDHAMSFSDFLRRREASTEATRRLGSPEARVLQQVDRDHLADRFSASNARLLAALDRPQDDPVLQFTKADKPPLTMEEMRDSEPYRHYSALADAIYESLA